MQEGNLPTEVAQEPAEEARLSQGDEIKSSIMGPVKHRKAITFADTTQTTETEHGSQASTSTYKDALSQPAPHIPHRQRLIWLQKRRNPGLWVQCDECDRWRFLAHVVDAHELPARWFCKMNPDKSAAACSIPEAPLRLREEEDLIHGEYSAGSVVWARLAGWPWWPAMVDDCPDTEQFYWLDGFSDIPTHYHVVFFDAFEATRAWISSDNLKPFGKAPKGTKQNKYRKRLEKAVSQAQDAMKLTLDKRLSKYSFIARYTGSINKPRKINKNELRRFQKKLNKLYDIEFMNESTDEDDEPNQNDSTTVIKKTENMLLVGTPKSKKNKRRRTNTNKDENIEKKVHTKTPSRETSIDNANKTKDIKQAEEPSQDDLTNFIQPDSLMAQVGSNVTSTVPDETYDNDTSATYVPGNEENSDSLRNTTSSNMEKRAVSPCSDDFDF